MSLRGWIVLLLASAVACGPEVGESDEGSGDGSGSGNDDESSSGDLLCEELGNEVHGEPVAVTIRNASAAPIYLVQQYFCESSFLTIEDPAGEVIEWRSDGWVISCEALAGPSPSCGGPACLGETVRIDPGGQYDQSWPAFVHDPMMLEPMCSMTQNFDCGTSCFIERTPTPGTYRFSVDAAFELDCGDAPCPECENDHGDGACSIFLDVAGLGSDRVTASADIAYPGTTSTEIVFE